MSKVSALILAVHLLAASARAAAFTLTVSTTGPNSPSVVVSSNPTTGINCGSTNTQCTASYAAGTVVTLTEIPASTASFAGWTYANGCATNSTTCKVTMSAAAAVSAAFNPVFDLSLFGNGLGAVTASSGAVNCTWTNGCARGASQRYSYPKGTSVVLTEVAGASSTFAGWTGNAGCSHASTCTFALNGYNVIVATFSSYGPFTIKLNVVGFGVVVSSPSGINCPGVSCSHQFSSGTVVHLSTRALAGSFFSGWANGGCGGKTPCVVTSSSTQQGLGGAESPAAFFYKSNP